MVDGSQEFANLFVNHTCYFLDDEDLLNLPLLQKTIIILMTLSSLNNYLRYMFFLKFF